MVKFHLISLDRLFLVYKFIVLMYLDLINWSSLYVTSSRWYPQLVQSGKHSSSSVAYSILVFWRKFRIIRFPHVAISVILHSLNNYLCEVKWQSQKCVHTAYRKHARTIDKKILSFKKEMRSFTLHNFGRVACLCILKSVLCCNQKQPLVPDWTYLYPLRLKYGLEQPQFKANCMTV